MNAEVKKQWVDALRSGNYKQGIAALKHDDTYCCLGVLCDLHIKTTGDKWVQYQGRKLCSYGGCEALLPIPVAKWAGLLPDDSKLPVYDFDVTVPRESGGRESLAYLNDRGVTFNEIATLIESSL